jgi:tRNA pseudouridine55 synthase
MSASSIDGVLVIDKPRGPTSHDVVARLRRAFRTRAVGHAGTLDPMATGVLVVALGEATKLVPWLTAHDKGYAASIALGIETDTLDAAGREVRRVEPSQALRDALAEDRSVPAGTAREAREPCGPSEPLAMAEAFARERARTLQVPPVYSAIRTDGERAFARARRGETPELAARVVVVRRLALVSCTAEPPSLAIEVETGKGYYVRALARDLAEGLGTVGHLTALRRTRSGCFVVGEAAQLDAPPDELRARVVPLATAAARALPVVRLGVTGARDARHGRPVVAAEMEIEDALASAPRVPRIPSAWLDAAGTLVAVGQFEDDGHGRVLRGFGGEAPLEG